ncbi:MAG: autotransporter-associated beta strand repeat-containing protein, partial [Luteolibacter sp.]
SGTLSLGANDRLADGATVTVAGGILDTTGSNRTDTVSIFNMSSGSLNGGGTITAGTYDLSGGTVTGNLGAGTLNSSGAVFLNGTSDAGTVNVTAGTLTLGSANRLSDSAAVTVSGGALAIGGNNDAVGTVVLSGGSITGTGGTLTGSSYDMRSGLVSAILGGSAIALTKTTAGAVTLTGTNTYTGNTSVSGGTLVINGDQTAATGNVSVTGTLAGTGTVGGSTTINSGGHLAVGDGTAGSTGTETFKQNLTFVSGSIFDWDLNATNNVVDPGSAPNQGSYDKVVASGTAGTMTGTSIFNVVLGTNGFADAFWDSTKTWSNIFTGSGATGANLTAIFSTFSGTNVNSDGSVTGQGQFTFNGGTTLTWSAVPETSTAFAGLLIGAGLLRRRRKN